MSTPNVVPECEFLVPACLFPASAMSYRRWVGDACHRMESNTVADESAPEDGLGHPYVAVTLFHDLCNLRNDVPEDGMFLCQWYHELKTKQPRRAGHAA